MPEIINRKKVPSKLSMLRERERRFVVALVVGNLCQTDAARVAGYADNGRGSIRVCAHNLVRRAHICDAIDELAWEQFRHQYIPVHKRVLSSNHLAQVEKTKLKARKERADYKALQELGIEI